MSDGSTQTRFGDVQDGVQSCCGPQDVENAATWSGSGCSCAIFWGLREGKYVDKHGAAALLEQPLHVLLRAPPLRPACACVCRCVCVFAHVVCACVCVCACAYLSPARYATWPTYSMMHPDARASLRRVVPSCVTHEACACVLHVHATEA